MMCFMCRYYTDILQHMFSVVTDTSHTAGLTMHATILAYMFTLVESEKVKDGDELWRKQLVVEQNLHLIVVPGNCATQRSRQDGYQHGSHTGGPVFF